LRAGWLVLWGSILLCAGAVAARTQQSSTPDANAAQTAPPLTDGPTIFHERGCAQCHTIRGVGGTKGPDLSGVGRRLKKDKIEDQIVHGGGAMPAFGDALPPEEVKVLVKYLSKQRVKTKKVKASAPAATS
jgi:ubiquinol-cytochrome c reductase cytochrome b subunit